MATNQGTSPPVIDATATPNFYTNFPVPAPMVSNGDKVANWEFFKQTWQDYEIATGLDQKDP